MKRVLVCLWIALCGLSCQAVTLPDVTIRDVDGKEVKVASLAKTGRPVIITFFATWCGPCKRELKALNQVYADWQKETGVEIYIVSIDKGEDVQKVKTMVDGYGWKFHVLLDPDGTFKKPMNVEHIPHMYVLNSKGKIVYKHVGYEPGDEAKIRKYLR